MRGWYIIDKPDGKYYVCRYCGRRQDYPSDVCESCGHSADSGDKEGNI